VWINRNSSGASCREWFYRDIRRPARKELDCELRGRKGDIVWGVKGFRPKLNQSNMSARRHEAVTPERLEEGRHFGGKGGNIGRRYPGEDVGAALVLSLVEDAVVNQWEYSMVLCSGGG
jgi:hypothetical protein